MICDRAELCVLGCKLVMRHSRFVLIRISENPSIVITLRLRARILPTRRYRVDNPLIQSP